MPRKLIKYVPGEIALPNLAKDWLSKAMTPSGISSGATDTIKNGIRTIQGVITSTSTNTYGGKYFHTNIVNGWLNPNQASKKFIITCDFMDMTEKETGSVAFYSNGTMNAVDGVLRNTTQKNVWQRVACIGNIPNSIDSRRHGLSTGESFKYAFKEFAVYDVTDIDSSLYPAIARQDWYAINTGLEAIQMRAGRGIIRSGRRISIDTASEDEVASGTFDKAVTPDKLKAWVENGDSYKVYDNSGNVVLLENLAKTYLTESLTNTSGSQNGQSAVWDNIRSVWGESKGTGSVVDNCGMWYNYAICAGWIGQAAGSQNGTFILSFDMIDETDVAHTDATIYPYAAKSIIALSGVNNYVTETHKWTHIAFCFTLQNAQFSIDGRIRGIAPNLPYRYSYKNLALYNVTSIPQAYWPIIAKGQHPLLQGVEPVDITDNVISYKKATVADVVGGSTHKNYIVDAGTLHEAIDGGMDVTTMARRGVYTQISFDNGTTWESTVYDKWDDRIRSEFIIRNPNAAANSQQWFGFSAWTGVDALFPVVEGRTYLCILDVKNGSGVTLSKANLRYNSSTDNILSRLSTTSYTRLYATMSNGYFWIDVYPSTTGLVQLYIKTWRQYDVTGLTSAQIETLVNLPADQLDNAYRYYIKQDSVCPFISIVDVSSMSTVSVQAGLVYRIIATSGTHVLTVSNLPTDAVGDEAYIQIKTGSSSTITVQQPLMLMDAIKPNAINNCVVRFINGEARLYVEDVSNGYVVVTASGTEYGSLHYGLSNLSNIDVNYISFGSTVDNITVHSSEPIAFIHQPVSIVGNGRDITTIDFDHGVIGTDKSFYVGYATIKDVTVNGGNIQLENGGLEGVIKLEGSSLSLSGRTKFDANVIGANITIAPGSTVSGSGSIDLQYTESKRIILDRNILQGITISNGRLGIRIMESNSIVSILDSKIYNTSAASSNGSGICNDISSNTVSIIGCTISGNSTGGTGTIYSAGTTIIENCVIDKNWSANPCAVASYGSTTTVINTIVSNNVGRVDAGIHSRNGGTLNAINCLVIGNTTSNGDSAGGLAYNYGIMSITGCTISNNVSKSFCGGIGSYSNAKITITDCLITGNTATTQGGGLICRSNSVLTITGSTVTENVAPTGSAMHLTGGTTTIGDKNIINGEIYCDGNARVEFSGNNSFKGSLLSSSALIVLFSGATVNLQGNDNTNAIQGSTITAQGTFVVIDKNGTSHSYSAATKSNSKITNLGVWS